MEDNKKNVQNLKRIQKVEKAALDSIKKFIESSQKLSDNLTNIPVEDKKTVTLHLAQIATQCAVLTKKRTLQGVEAEMRIGLLSSQISKKDEEITQLQHHRNNYSFTEYYKQLSKMKKEKRQIKKQIPKWEKKKDTYKADADLCIDALNICGKISNRLVFFLSIAK